MALMFLLIRFSAHVYLIIWKQIYLNLNVYYDPILVVLMKLRSKPIQSARAVEYTDCISTEW